MHGGGAAHEPTLVARDHNPRVETRPHLAVVLDRREDKRLAVQQRLLLRELDALRAAFPEEWQPVRTRRPVGVKYNVFITVPHI